MFSKDEIYGIWAPPGALWSRWVKPVLFSFVDAALQSHPPLSTRFEPEWVPAPGSAAIVLDLPEEEGVLWSISLAKLGYRPVPLYNALPFSLEQKLTAPTFRPAAAVHVEPILAALVREASALKGTPLRADSPPAFLLDAARRFARADLTPGVFDNRSVCFSTDFPSAQFLLSHGISSAVIVQENMTFARDLLETLVAWQRGGVQIFRKRRNESGAPTPVVVERPSFLSNLWFRASIALGLHRSELGGFGGIVRASGG